jgi:hypothetical protein
MGTFIEINDTLQLTTEQGFPVHLLELQKHLANPVKTEDVQHLLFEFRDKAGARFFHYDPCRVYLVHNINGKWLFWGHIFIQSQSIYKKQDANGVWKEGDWLTSGTYKITEIYPPDYQRHFTQHEAPADRNFFKQPPKNPNPSR